MKRILIQLDTDALASTFDRVVAIDAGVDELFSYGGVTPENVEGLVHGAMFTRSPSNLKNTAIFIGGSNVTAGEALLAKVRKTLFDPLRVSVMMDSNGSNTTAAAAVIAASKHVDLTQTTALILGGTGPVGCRAAQILLSHGATVRLASRTLDKAQATCTQLAEHVDTAKLMPCESTSPEGLTAACDGAEVIIGAGAARVQFLTADQLFALTALKVALDLNAVAPEGLGGITMSDKAVTKHGKVCYGALGVGGTKMKIHTAAIQKLFEKNTFVLDTAAIFEIGRDLSS